MGANKGVDRVVEEAKSGRAEKAVVAAVGMIGFRNGITCGYLRDVVGTSPIGNEGVDELAEMTNLLAAQGYDTDRIVIDPSVVRGLGYYTGPVYEAELTFEILDEKGRKRQFGSVAGGGRYDDLVKRFTGQAVPATGGEHRVDRLLAALREKGRIVSKAQGAGCGYGDGSRADGGLSGDGGRIARGGYSRRGLSGQSEEFWQSAEICRQARKPGGGDCRE